MRLRLGSKLPAGHKEYDFRQVKIFAWYPIKIGDVIYFWEDINVEQRLEPVYGLIGFFNDGYQWVIKRVIENEKI